MRAKAPRRKRSERTEEAPPALRVVAPKPPIIRRKVVVPTPVSRPSSATKPPAAVESTHARGDRVWFQHDGVLRDGEIVRVTVDGGLVVAPLPTGDRLTLTPAQLLPPPQA